MVALETQRPTQSAQILQRAVCLVLHRHWLGNSRSVDTAQVVAGAEGKAEKVEGKAVTSTKRLIDTAALRPCLRILEDTVDGLRKRAIAAHNVFGNGTYLIPLAMVQEADEYLRGQQTRLAVEVELLVQNYEAEIEKQRAKLEPLGLFDREQYPSLLEVRQAFSIDWSYVSFATPERLETVDTALFEAANRKYDAKMAEAYEEVRLVLRETLRQFVGELVGKLEPKGDGKQRRYHGTMLRDLTEFLSTFSMRNITDDGELASIVARLRRLTNGLDAEQLRDFDNLRESVRGELSGVGDELDKLVVTSRRRISVGSLG